MVENNTQTHLDSLFDLFGEMGPWDKLDGYQDHDGNRCYTAVLTSADLNRYKENLEHLQKIIEKAKSALAFYAKIEDAPLGEEINCPDGTKVLKPFGEIARSVLKDLT